MDQALDILSWILIAIGGLFIVIGGIGLIRMPDVFTRMHAASLIETLGAGALLSGLMIQAGWTLITAKLVLVLAFLLFTSPTSTYALANAAWRSGVKPFTADEPENDLINGGCGPGENLEPAGSTRENQPSQST